LAPTKHTQNNKKDKVYKLLIPISNLFESWSDDGSMYLSMTLQALPSTPLSLQTFKLIIFVDISWKLVNEDNLLNLESAGKKQL
jgi:hypothetical protein